jgi:cytochrome c5
MKKALVLIILFTSVTLACHKKSLPVITDRTNEPIAPKPLIADVTPDLALGKSLFENRCSRCHDAPDPKKYNAMQWDGYLGIMMPRARLNPEQKVHVTAYVKANCLK